MSLNKESVISLSSDQSVARKPTLTGVPWLNNDETDSVPPRRRISVLQILKRSLLLLLVAILAGGGLMGWKFYEDASKLTGDKNPLSLFSAFRPSALKESNGRVNILLAGYSADDPGHQGADLTDSIMIISINPTTKSTVLVSVPRDLYVNIPGFGYNKINAAYEEGQSENFSANGYASGGMGLLEETLTEDFGVQFDYQALINYAAFKDAVNAVGGVTVTINSSDSRGLYDPNTNLDLPNGTVKLNGQEALNLARARGDGYGSYGFSDGDFDRTAHQQQILIALKNKASSASVIANPLKIASLADAIGNNVKTDMSIGVMETLYSKVKSIPDSKITSVTLNSYNGKDYLTDYETRSGESALIPTNGIGDYSAIQSLMSNLLANPTTDPTN